MGVWSDLQRLSQWPHRGSTTRFESEAAGWLSERLQGMGYRVAWQRFDAPAATLYAGPPLVGLVVVLAAVVALGSPGLWARLLAAAVALAAVALLVEEARLARPAFDLVLPRRPSQNVVAQMPGEPAPPGSPLVLVVAHYDTQRGSWLFAPWFRRALPAFFKAAYGAVALAVVGLVAGAAAAWLWPGWGGWRWVAGAGAAATGATMGFVAASGLFARPVNGANDNGSGTAVALALAERWAGRPPRGAELRFVFTGAEESGTRGMWAYLNSLGTAGGRKVYVVNVDNVGGGRLRALLKEGMLLPVPCGATLRELAEQMAAEDRLELWPRMLLLSTDGGPAAVRGFEALTFIGLDERGEIPNYHWFSDMIQHVDRQHLERVCETVSQFVERLLSRLGAGVPGRPGDGA